MRCVDAKTNRGSRCKSRTRLRIDPDDSRSLPDGRVACGAGWTTGVRGLALQAPRTTPRPCMPLLNPVMPVASMRAWPPSSNSNVKGAYNRTDRRTALTVTGGQAISSEPPSFQPGRTGEREKTSNERRHRGRYRSNFTNSCCRQKQAASRASGGQRGFPQTAVATPSRGLFPSGSSRTRVASSAANRARPSAINHTPSYRAVRS